MYSIALEKRLFIGRALNYCHMYKSITYEKKERGLLAWIMPLSLRNCRGDLFTKQMLLGENYTKDEVSEDFP